MNGFDLNINNYSVTELEELLTLDKNYNLDEIKYKKDGICMKIADDDTISFDMKAKLEIFCEKASVLLKDKVNKNVGSGGSGGSGGTGGSVGGAGGGEGGSPGAAGSLDP